MLRLRLIADPACDARRNMATDETLFRLASESGFDATLRLYGWSPSALSLGRRQKRAEVIREELANGIDIVKRPGGGSAVWHDEEVTYCYVQNLDRLPLPGGDRWRDLFTALLKELGAHDADLPHRQTGPHTGTQTICFAQSESDEPTVRGKKWVGNSRRKSRHAFMQHGSILLRRQPDILARLLKHPEPDRSVGLYEIVPGLDAETVRTTFVRTLALLFGMEVVRGDYTGREIAEAERLTQEKWDAETLPTVSR